MGGMEQKHLTPRQVVAELDKYIVGQADAKRAVAVAIRNRWRRQQLPESMRQDVAPKNILMIGPTGVGKTEIARRLAGLTGAPFIKVEATKYTEVGYHGRDVESMIRDLLDSAIALVREEMTEAVRGPAELAVEDRILDHLLPGSGGNYTPMDNDDETQTKRKRTREKLREQLRAGELEDRPIEVNVEDRPTAAAVLGNAGMGMDVEFQSMFEKMLPVKRETKRVTVGDARKILLGQEAEKLIEKDRITRTAVERVEQAGIVFLDEIDKVCGPESKQGPDVSRQGVQRDLLPIVEGSTVMTKHGPVKTDHILFIASGAFHVSKPSDLLPELQGRLPIRVELKPLSKEDFRRILTEPEASLIRQYRALMETENLTLDFTDDAIDALADVAVHLNSTVENIGARRLQTVMERVLDEISYNASDRAGVAVTIDAAYVREHVGDLANNTDLSRFIL